MLEDRREKCHVIIHGAAVTTGGIGAGLAQIPLADSIPITAAQRSFRRFFSFSNWKECCRSFNRMDTWYWKCFKGFYCCCIDRSYRLGCSQTF